MRRKLGKIHSFFQSKSIPSVASTVSILRAKRKRWILVIIHPEDSGWGQRDFKEVFLITLIFIFLKENLLLHWNHVIGIMESFSLSVAILLFCWLKVVAEFIGFSHHGGLLFQMHLLETVKRSQLLFLHCNSFTSSQHRHNGIADLHSCQLHQTIVLL